MIFTSKQTTYREDRGEISMTTILPDFAQATFEPGTPIDNPYFPLTPGTVLSYQGKLYETEEIIEEVAKEIGEEIAEEIVEELGLENDFDDDDELNELAEEIEEELEETIDEIVDEIIDELADEEIEEFDPEELAEVIAKELIEDITEELTGEEIESNDDDEIDDFVDEIVEELDDGIDELAVEAAEEIADAQADLFATESNQVFVTYNTKNILGVETTVVRDVAWDEGILVEDTFDWYAQDSLGNVWLLGETVTEYEYDEAGNVIDTDDSESWLAGEGQSLPGLIMAANPETGTAYYQRFDIGEAENQAEVVESEVSLTVDGDNFEDVIKIKEFSALDPEEFDFKYYASGVGLVFEEEIEEDQLASTSELDDTYKVLESYTVDFETTAAGDKLLAGTIITNQYDSFSGLTISTPRDEFGAMIFDSANPTGGDFDLATEDQGNVLIISEDGDSSDPDDKAGGGTIRFQWSDDVLVKSIGLLGIDRSGGSITAFDDDGDLLRTVAIPDLGDNSLGQVDINTAEVAYLDVNFFNGGAITEVSFNSLSEVELV